jgi:hypothetical protein
MKIIKVNNCGECLYKDTYFPLSGENYLGYPESYKFCRYRYIKTGEIKEIENKEMISEWCDLDNYEDVK